MSFPYYVNDAQEECHDTVCTNCGTTRKGEKKCFACGSSKHERFLTSRARGRGESSAKSADTDDSPRQ
jgi:hypothetical protein